MSFEDFVYQQFEQEMEHNDRIFGSKIEKNMSFDVWKDQLDSTNWMQLGKDYYEKNR